MTRISRAIILGAAAALLIVSSPARAHELDPWTVDICGAGSIGSFRVWDTFGCLVDITVTSANPAVATVVPPAMIRTADQRFEVRGVSIGTTQLTVQWVGVGAGCTEVGSEVLGVVVRSVTAPECAPVSSANQPYAATAGDPVSTSTGEHFGAALDLASGGPMPLVMARWHGSMLTRTPTPGPLGEGWRHSYDSRLEVSSARVLLKTWRGRQIEFAPASGAFAQRDGVDLPLVLTTTGSEYRVLHVATGASQVYQPTGELLRLEDGRGNTVTLAYALGRLTSVSDALGRRFDLAYEPASGRLASVTYGARVVRYGYTAGRLTSVTDPAGQITQYAYDASGRMSFETAPSGARVTSQTYDAAERVTSQTDAIGGTWTMSFAPPLTSITDPLGHVQQHEHASGRLVRLVDELGAAVILEHDAAGRRTTVIDRRGNRTVATFDATSRRLATYTDTAGASQTFAYAARGAAFDLASVTRADATTVAFERDARGNITALVDAAGGRWTFVRNARGQPQSVTDPSGGTASVTYGPSALAASFTDATGRTTRFSYDAFDLPVRVERPDGSARATTRDARGLPTRVTDEEGREVTLAWDVDGRLASATDALGGITSLARDVAGRVVGITDPLGGTTRLERDALGRITRFADASGVSVSYAYDAAGRLTSITDGAGGIWTLEHDAEGVLTRATDPEGHAWRVTTDAMGRRTSVTGPDDRASSAAYDVMGRVTSATDRLGGVTRPTRDVLGRVRSVELPDGATVSVARDAVGRPTRLVDPRGNAWTMTRDAAGRATATTDPLGRMRSATHDTVGRVARVTFPMSAGSVDATYSRTGALTQLRYSDGTLLRFSYDAADRLLTADGVTLVRDLAGRIVESNGVRVARGADGRIERVDLAAGRALLYTYDAAGRLASVADWLGGTTRFSYDRRGLVSGIERPNAIATSYTRDGYGRVTRIDDGTIASHALIRDAAGRVMSATRSVPVVPRFTSGTRTFSYDAANQLEGREHDALGRLTRDGELAITWNLASQITRVVRGTLDVSFVRDAFGQPLERTEGGVTRSSVWSYAHGRPTLVVEREGGADVRYHVTTPSGMPLYTMDTAGSRRFLHYDETGSTRVVTDDSGAVLAAYAYTPFGEVVGGPVLPPSTGGGGVEQQPYAWGGGIGFYYHPDLGLVHPADTSLGTDVYDPSLLREPVGGPSATSGLDSGGWSMRAVFDELLEGEAVETLDLGEPLVAEGSLDTTAPAADYTGYYVPNGNRMLDSSGAAAFVFNLLSDDPALRDVPETESKLAGSILDEITEVLVLVGPSGGSDRNLPASPPGSLPAPPSEPPIHSILDEIAPPAVPRPRTVDSCVDSLHIYECGRSDAGDAFEAYVGIGTGGEASWMRAQVRR